MSVYEINKDFSNSKNGRQSSYEGTWDTAYREDDIITHILRCEFGEEWSCHGDMNGKLTLYYNQNPKAIFIFNEPWSWEDSPNKHKWSLSTVDDCVSFDIILFIANFISYPKYKIKDKLLEYSKYDEYLEEKKRKRLADDDNFNKRIQFSRYLTIRYFKEWPYLRLCILSGGEVLLEMNSTGVHPYDTIAYTLLKYKKGEFTGDDDVYYPMFMMAVEKCIAYGII